MLISETEYKHQVETDIRPFHDVLLGLFFISIGMLLDWRLVLERWPLVLLLLVVPTLFKAALVALIARGLGATSGVALRTGLYLAQAGEFGFVLLTLAQKNALGAPELLNPILAGMVLSMLATPFIVMYSNRIVMKLGQQRVAAAVPANDDALRASPSTPTSTSSFAATGAAARIWHACWRAKGYPIWRWTWTRTGYARLQQQGIPWCSATPPACRP